MPLTFERATPADADALLALQIAAFHDDHRLYGVPLGGPPGYTSKEVLLKAIAEDIYYKIVQEGQSVGGIVVFDRGGGHFHLDTLFVDPTRHGQGIGTQAMQFIEAALGGDVWTLDTPAYATRNHHFYEKLGYVRMGEKEVEILLYMYEKRRA